MVTIIDRKVDEKVVKKEQKNRFKRENQSGYKQSSETTFFIFPKTKMWMN